jgi:hypothetical protein
MKEDYDGAEPTASSVSVLNLLTLSQLVHDSALADRIERTLGAFATRLERMGRAVPMMGAALAAYHAGVRQLIIVGEEPGPLVETAARHYRPFDVTLVLDERQRTTLGAEMPWLTAMTPIDGRATAFACRAFVCDRPVTTAAELLAIL